jgi:hypothetical protein
MKAPFLLPSPTPNATVHDIWIWKSMEFIYIPNWRMFQDLRPKKIKNTENIRQNFGGAPLPSGDGLGLLHCKKRLAIFPCPAGMSLTTLSLAGNY